MFQFLSIVFAAGVLVAPGLEVEGSIRAMDEREV